MKIDFEHLKVYTEITKQKSIVTDVKLQLSDHLYQNGQGIAYHALALKIYNSSGECELTDEEYQLLISYAEKWFTPMVIDALRECK